VHQEAIGHVLQPLLCLIGIDRSPAAPRIGSCWWPPAAFRRPPPAGCGAGTRAASPPDRGGRGPPPWRSRGRQTGSTQSGSATSRARGPAGRHLPWRRRAPQGAGREGAAAIRKPEGRVGSGGSQLGFRAPPTVPGTGSSTLRRPRKCLSVRCSPCSSTRTEPATVSTPPVSASWLARRCRNGRKPTPCTAPRQWSNRRACSAMGRAHSCQPSPLRFGPTPPQSGWPALSGRCGDGHGRDRTPP